MIFQVLKGNSKLHNFPYTPIQHRHNSGSGFTEVKDMILMLLKKQNFEKVTSLYKGVHTSSHEVETPRRAVCGVLS